MARVTKLQGVALREKQDVLERRRTQPLPDASRNTNPNNLARPDEIRSKALRPGPASAVLFSVASRVARETYANLC